MFLIDDVLLALAGKYLVPLVGDAVGSLFGDDAQPTAKAITTAVAQTAIDTAAKATGITITDETSMQQAAAAIQADPEKLATYQRALNEKALAAMAEETKRLALDNEDRASARAQTVTLAQAGSAIAWGAPSVSLVVLVTFGVVLYRVLSMPAGQSDPNATLMLGALTTMATAVVSYWVGSSAGSAAKDRLLRHGGGDAVSAPIPGRKPAR